MESTQTLGDYAAGEIRATLARKRTTGRELASKLGVSRSWVSYRLTGTTEITLNDLARIAAALDIDIAALLPAPADRGIRYTSHALTSETTRDSPIRTTHPHPDDQRDRSTPGTDRTGIRRPAIRLRRYAGAPA